MRGAGEQKSEGAVAAALSTALDAAEAQSLRDRAERELREIVEHSPMRVRAWLSLSFLYDARGEFARSAWATRQAVGADAFLDEARNLLEEHFYDALRREDMPDAARDCEVGAAQYATYVVFTECRLTLLE